MSFMFENLEVYKKASALADELSTLTESSPKSNYYLADQLNRAALSIATNIAKGNGKYHKADRVNFFRIAEVRLLNVYPFWNYANARSWSKKTTQRCLKKDWMRFARCYRGL